MDTFSTLIDFVLRNIVFIGLFVVGWVFGRIHEQAHLKSLNKNEKMLGHIIVSSERFYCPMIANNREGKLVLGSVVIAQDYFKMIVANVMNLFGLNLITYESLFERARREALVRMRREAEFIGCNQIFGVRLEVTTINATGSMVEAIAYGTAVYSVGESKVPPPLPRG